MYTLLLADDSVTIQRVIELTFADEDVRVIAVSTGEQAIAAMAAETPDIVLADVDMPGISGYEVARFIRATPHLAHARILLLAGAFEPVDRDRAEEVGTDGVLVKPFEPQQLIARVRELLALPGGMPAPEPAGSAALGASRAGALDTSPAGELLSAASTGSVDDYFERLDQALGGSSDGGLDVARDPAGPPEPQATKAPSVADAFAVLLAAEQETSGADGWPPRSAAPDALVEEVARRVLERLSHAAVHAAVADIVSATAERLVREEIERIKAAIEEPPGV
jgi:CheY-like chemotaxis protein